MLTTRERHQLEDRVGEDQLHCLGKVLPHVEEERRTGRDHLSRILENRWNLDVKDYGLLRLRQSNGETNYVGRMKVGIANLNNLESLGGWDK